MKGEIKMEEEKGGLIVQVTQANEAQPIANANVTVSKTTENGEMLLNVLKTNRNGKTPKIYLDAPPQENSQSPSDLPKFNNYNIRVDYPGFYTFEGLDVPVFAGQTSIQPVALLPLPEGVENGKRITVVEREPDLS